MSTRNMIGKAIKVLVDDIEVLDATVIRIEAQEADEVELMCEVEDTGREYLIQIPAPEEDEV